MKILCYSAKDYDRKYFTNENVGNLQLDFQDCSLNSETVKLVDGYDAVCIFVNDECDRNILTHLQKNGVRCVLLRCAGFNNVDLVAAKELGISVARVPKYSPYAVAEHTVGLLLCLNRKIHKAHNRIRENNFSLSGLIGYDLHEKTIGVIGYGEIGQVFAKIMSGFSCNVIFYDPYAESTCDEHKKVELEYLFAHSDVISLHCPLSDANHHLMDATNLAKVKQNAVIINTSRGALIDTQAIIGSLKSKKISGLAIDVYEEEQNIFFKDHSEEIVVDDSFERLLTFPNVLITGHQAFLTHEALTSIAKTTINNAICILNDKICENVL